MCLPVVAKHINHVIAAHGAHKTDVYKMLTCPLIAVNSPIKEILREKGKAPWRVVHEFG